MKVNGTFIRTADWTAYCIDCNKVIKSCPNGTFAEGAMNLHHKYNPNHKVIVGKVNYIKDNQGT